MSLVYFILEGFVTVMVHYTDVIICITKLLFPFKKSANIEAYKHMDRSEACFPMAGIPKVGVASIFIGGSVLFK
jgi:hypothetical protein